jgi:hypothetical protein
MVMAAEADYERAWAELGEAIERNGLLIEQQQAFEDAEQAAYLARWRVEHGREEYGWGVYVMAALAWAILWGAALWPWVAAMWQWVWGAL